MLLKETLTPQQKIELFSGNATGIFKHLFVDGNPLYVMSEQLSIGYYIYHSPNKQISRTYSETIDFIKENPSITQSADEIMARIISGRFMDKWLRIESTLRDSYNPLDSISITESKEAGNTETKTYGTVVTTGGQDTDTLRKEGTITDDGNTGTDETVIYSRSIDSGVYGFNSSNAVPSDSDSESSSETTTGSAETNTSHNQRTTDETHTTTREKGSTESKTGEDTLSLDVDETTHTSGRKTSGAELVQAEIDVRKLNILFDIIYTDLDSVLTLQVY